LDGKLTARNLQLIRFSQGLVTPEIKQWRDEGHCSFIAPCCDQVYYGRPEDLETFPANLNGDNRFKLEEGIGAYKFLLESVSGFLSEDVGETHSRRQFIDGWRRFSANNPNVSKLYQKLVSDIKKDGLYLQEEVLGEHKNTKRVSVARDLSGQKKGDDVLIVGEVKDGKKGLKIAQYTRDIIKLSENCQDPSGKMQGRDNFIKVTHPDSDVLDVLRRDIQDLKENGQVRSEVDFADFSEIGKYFEQCDRVYVDLAMGKDMEADHIMMAAWGSRNRQDNTMTHIRGNPNTRQESTGLWIDFCDAYGFIPPEGITDEIGVRSQRNREVIAEFGLKAQRIVELRFEGERNPLAIIRHEEECDQDSNPEPPWA
tara:strand:- start:221 stop:1327 length:1107 start_codon:yes stop_codon:yes gene_type:complete